jgi:enoyl-CoA hydratase/carnithine racemase
MNPRTFLVVHKPYAERRTMATARRRWPARHVAVTSEQISFEDYCAGQIPPARVLSMLAGEAIRLESYAATGLIDLDEPVPDDLLDAARALQAAGYDSRAVRQ